MATLIDLKAELEPYKNTLVLDHFEVVRLVDVIDGEEDYYWIYDNHIRGVVHSSCCGGWTALKGVLSDEEYGRLVHIWNLNNIEQAI